MSLVGVVGLGTPQDREEVLRCHQPDAFVVVVYIPKLSKEKTQVELQTRTEGTKDPSASVARPNQAQHS